MVVPFIYILIKSDETLYDRWYYESCLLPGKLRVKNVKWLCPSHSAAVGLVTIEWHCSSLSFCAGICSFTAFLDKDGPKSQTSSSCYGLLDTSRPEAWPWIPSPSLQPSYRWPWTDPQGNVLEEWDHLLPLAWISSTIILLHWFQSWWEFLMRSLFSHLTAMTFHQKWHNF